MSLKTFHLLFITISTMLAFFLGVWCVKSYQVTALWVELVGGVASFVAGAGLIVYEVFFLRKMKRLHIS